MLKEIHDDVQNRFTRRLFFFIAAACANIVGDNISAQDLKIPAVYILFVLYKQHPIERHPFLQLFHDTLTHGPDQQPFVLMIKYILKNGVENISSHTSQSVSQLVISLNSELSNIQCPTQQKIPFVGTFSTVAVPSHVSEASHSFSEEDNRLNQGNSGIQQQQNTSPFLSALEVAPDFEPPFLRPVPSIYTLSFEDLYWIETEPPLEFQWDDTLETSDDILAVPSQQPNQETST
ncbi:MAG: hypothetical protein EZS28_004306 [Streblomastix strix]|uniref:CCR4-NOT transcription complex subunit 11 n=1 Tax=Streblomastix strix TaxID=222440 RepID=A0A5J4X048_9EUKA|nr:MAG: hypothetical protein EZS28_004306 [Streblomastix strix]